MNVRQKKSVREPVRLTSLSRNTRAHVAQGAGAEGAGDRYGSLSTAHLSLSVRRTYTMR